MKTPDEIKKTLHLCQLEHKVGWKCTTCPYLQAAPCCDALHKDALALIQQLEAQVPRWISVEERLPENYEPVIIWRSDYHVASIGWLICDDWSVPKGVRVTHWMPLPEAPKEDAHGQANHD